MSINGFLVRNELDISAGVAISPLRIAFTGQQGAAVPVTPAGGYTYYLRYIRYICTGPTLQVDTLYTALHDRNEVLTQSLRNRYTIVTKLLHNRCIIVA